MKTGDSNMNKRTNSKTRFLLASMIFDIEKMGNNSLVVNWIFDTTDKKKPIKMSFRYQWKDLEAGYPLNDKVRNMFEKGGIVSTTKALFESLIVRHDLKFDIRITDELHVTENGKTLPFMGDFDNAVKFLTK